MLARTLTEADRLLYTTSQAAEVLNMSRSSLYREFQRGSITGILIGPKKIRRVSKSELERYVQARQAEADAAKAGQK